MLPLYCNHDPSNQYLIVPTAAPASLGVENIYEGLYITVLLFVYNECTVLHQLEENKSREVQIQVESFVHCPGGTSGEANKDKEIISRSRRIQLTNR